jgi:hypothetical protein
MGLHFGSPPEKVLKSIIKEAKDNDFDLSMQICNTSMEMLIDGKKPFELILIESLVMLEYCVRYQYEHGTCADCKKGTRQ